MFDNPYAPYGIALIYCNPETDFSVISFEGGILKNKPCKTIFIFAVVEFGADLGD